MLPPIEEWDLSIIDQIASKDVPESVELERKASPKFDTSTGAAVRATVDELAKQICAFANAGGGVIVYGVKDTKDGGGRDAGVDSTAKGKSVTDWIDEQLPKLTVRPVLNVRTRFIEYAGGRGALVVQVPASESRPHWVKENGRELAYLRVGGTSAPMSFQTFLDIHSRGGAPIVQVEDLSRWRRGMTDNPTLQYRQMHFWPACSLVGGPICETWMIEISGPGGASFGTKNAGAHIIARNRVAIPGEGPLYPKRITPPRYSIEISLEKAVTADDTRLILVRLFAGSSPPVERRFLLSQLFRLPSAPEVPNPFDS